MSCLRELRSLGVPFFDEAAKNLLNALLQLRYGVEDLNCKLAAMTKEKMALKKTIRDLVAEKERLVEIVEERGNNCIKSAESCINESESLGSRSENASFYMAPQTSSSVTNIRKPSATSDGPNHYAPKTSLSSVPVVAPRGNFEPPFVEDGNEPVFIVTSSGSAELPTSYKKETAAPMGCCIDFGNTKEGEFSYGGELSLKDSVDVIEGPVQKPSESAVDHSDDSCQSVTVIEEFKETMQAGHPHVNGKCPFPPRASFSKCPLEKGPATSSCTRMFSTSDAGEADPLTSSSEEVMGTSFVPHERPSMEGSFAKEAVMKGLGRPLMRANSESDYERSFCPESTSSHDKSCVCPVCGKTLSRKGNLKMHLLIHTGERPFGCPYCEASFVQKGNLKTHMRKHTGERPYKCGICRFSFAQKGNLRIHTRMHADNPHTCLSCGVSCGDLPSFENHMKSHSEEQIVADTDMDTEQ